jgi:hypothetical protein
VASTLVAADLHLAADVGGHIAAKVTLDLVVRFDEVAELNELFVDQIEDALVRADAGCGEGGLGTGATDSKYICQCDLYALIAREIYTYEACHLRQFLPLDKGVET